MIAYQSVAYSHVHSAIEVCELKRRLSVHEKRERRDIPVKAVFEPVGIAYLHRVPVAAQVHPSVRAVSHTTYAVKKDSVVQVWESHRNHALQLQRGCFLNIYSKRATVIVGNLKRGIWASVELRETLQFLWEIEVRFLQILYQHGSRVSDALENQMLSYTKPITQNYTMFVNHKTRLNRV